MTAKWQAGHTYVPGDLVRPTSTPAQTVEQPDNPSFETGDLTGWSTSDTDRWTVQTGGSYEGTHFVQATGSGETALYGSYAPISPGQHATASAFGKITNHGTDDATFQTVLEWHDDSGMLSFVQGNGVSGQGGSWHQSVAAGNAPDGATKFRISLKANTGTHGSTVEWDAASYDYDIQTIPAGLVYKATQANPGKSGTTEPTWPDTTGVEVTDNQVTWEGFIATRIVWKAKPLLKSGTTEPTWPAVDNGAIKDNIIDWKAVTPRVTDALVPQSKIVTIAANKVFVGDGDVVRYCATNNATDWTSEQDAGYLPTGLQAVGETECTALGIYRGNLVAWTASSMEVWQVDPDPARMAIVDTVEGVGTTFVRAAIGMMNDLFFLSPLGVRSVSTSATTGTMGAADVGSPVDPLVRAAIDAAMADGISPVGVFYSNASQFWIFLGDEAYVYTISQATGVKAWSRYTFPWSVTHACVKDGNLYVRTSDNDVYVLDEAQFFDDVRDNYQPYEVVAQWPWLDLGAPGLEKMLVGCDVVFDESTEASGGSTPVTPPSMSLTGDLPGGYTKNPVSYAYQLTGAQLPATWGISAGALPTGLSMDANGVVTGTVTAGGSYSWVVSVTDADGNTADCPDAAAFESVAWDPSRTAARLTLSNGNLTGTINTNAGGIIQESTNTTLSREASTANHYFEVKYSYVEKILASGTVFVGIAKLGDVASQGTSWGAGMTIGSYGLRGYDGLKFNNNAGTTYGSAYGTGDVIGVLVKNGKLYFSKNGVWWGDPIAETGAAFSGLSGQFFPNACGNYLNDSFTGRFSATDLSYSPPTGSKAWGDS